MYEQYVLSIYCRRGHAAYRSAGQLFEKKQDTQARPTVGTSCHPHHPRGLEKSLGSELLPTI